MSSPEVLRKLATSPFDLSAPGSLTVQRISQYTCRQNSFSLLYSTQQIDEAVLAELQQLADESQAVEQFIMMKKGAVMNRVAGCDSENRQVLHTASRDIFNELSAEPEASGKARAELDRLRHFLNDLRNRRLTNQQGKIFTDMIQIGIGGSDLGPRALYLALAAFRNPERNVHFIANVDPDDTATVLRNLDLSRTLVNVVSKSGTTLETLTNEELVRRAYVQAGLEPRHHFIAVTGKGSPMDNPDKYLRSFYMYDYIGGRYSTTSMVGGVMLGFALGYDNFIEILKGANSMDVGAEEKDIRKNIPLLMALLGIWNHNFLGFETLAILPYSQALIRFPAHIQQCDMESNGKSISRLGTPLNHQSGPIIWGEVGTNGQHAFYQLIHQGTTIVPVEFIGFRQNQYEQDMDIKGTTSQEKLVANLLAQSIALACGRDNNNPNRRFSGNRPNMVLMADRLTPRTMGELLALYEAKIVFQGFVWNINSFDQEGVQLGKQLANQLLDHFQGMRQEKGYCAADRDDPGWALLKAADMNQKI